MLARAGFLIMSFLAILLSLGAPGLGWMLATLAMIGVSLCWRRVGRRWVWICLGVTLIHLLTLGPLGGGGASSFGDSPAFGIVFTAAPFVAGAAALASAYWRSSR